MHEYTHGVLMMAEELFQKLLGFDAHIYVKLSDIAGSPQIVFLFCPWKSMMHAWITGTHYPYVETD